MINAAIVCVLWLYAAILSCCSFKYSKPKGFFAIAVIILLFVAFRDGTTLNDYSNYVDLYYNNRLNEVEVSFYFIKNITHYLGGIMGLFVIYAVLCVSTKIIGIYKLTNLLFLTLGIYISNIMILHDMTQIRAGVTSGIFLCSIPYLMRKEKVKYIFCVLLASFFHFSGLLLFIPCLYWVNKLRESKWFYWGIIPIGYLIGNTIFDIANFPIEPIRQKLQMYQNLQATGSAGLKDLNVFNPYIIFRIALYYILLYKAQVIEPYNKYFKCILFIEAIALFIFPAFSSLAILGYRGSELIGVVEIVLYPMLYYILRPKVLAKLSVIGIGGLLLIINLTYKHLIYL